MKTFTVRRWPCIICRIYKQILFKNWTIRYEIFY